jgi:hypothetical protein
MQAIEIFEIYYSTFQLLVHQSSMLTGKLRKSHMLVSLGYKFVIMDRAAARTVGWWVESHSEN